MLTFFWSSSDGYAFAFDLNKFPCLSQFLLTEIRKIAICHPIVSCFAEIFLCETQQILFNCWILINIIITSRECSYQI